MGNSGFVFNTTDRPMLGVQFNTAHKICDVGGLVPVIGFGFDIGNTIIYDLEGYKVKTAASIAGAGLNLFGAGLLAKGTMSSLDNFAEAGIKYSDDVIEAGVKSGIGYSKSGRATISSADRIKIDAWDYTPSDELYSKYKNVFVNPKYYN